VGPPLGGYLAEPVLKYPFLFKKDSIWDKYPYLLPNVLAAVSLLITCVIALFFLEEVHPIIKHQRDLSGRILTGLRNLFSCRPWSYNNGLYAAVNSTEELAVELEDLMGEEGNKAEPVQVPSINRKLAFTNQVKLQILSFSILGYVKLSVLAIEPVFLGTPTQKTYGGFFHHIFGMNGGFGLDTTATSHILLTQAIAAICSQIFLVPWIVKNFGPLRSYKLVLTVFLGVFFIMPFSAGLPSILGIGVVIISLWTYALINVLGTTCQGIM